MIIQYRGGSLREEIEAMRDHLALSHETDPALISAGDVADALTMLLEATLKPVPPPEESEER